jgi:hypothetical protein
VNKIKAFCATLWFTIKSKIEMLQYRIKHGELFAKYELSPRGERLCDYCIKVLEDENYTYSDYGELLLHDELNSMAKKCNLSRQAMAFHVLYISLGVA